MEAPLTAPVMAPLTAPVMEVRPSSGQKIFASGRGDEKTRFDFGPAGFYQWEPAPTKIVPREEQAVDFESFPRALHWVPPTWSLAPTTGTPAANGGNYVVQLAPFATVEQAWKLCSSLKSAGGLCIVQRN